MKKFLKHFLTIITEVVVLIISVYWYSNNGGFESIITGIISLSGLIASIILLIKYPTPFIDISYVFNGKSKSATQASYLTPRDENGNFQVTIGNFIGRRKFTWRYKMNLVNNTTLTAFKPKLYVTKQFANL